MTPVREFVAANAPLALSIGGLLIGCVFGAVAFATNYCPMGGLADIHLFGDYRRFRAWVLAAATALLGTQLLQGLAIVALDRSMYLAAEVNWVGHIVGGGMLGFGMVL